MLPNSWGALDWWIPVAVVVAIASPVIYWSCLSGKMHSLTRLGLVGLKLAAIGLLGLCLLEPLHRYTRPEPGSNSLVVMADTSQSLEVKDKGQSLTRAALLARKLNDQSEWLDNLDNQFELRKYEFNSRLTPVQDFEQYSATGLGSAISASLANIGRNHSGKPIAGIVLLTDGNQAGSEISDSDLAQLPPIYPVVVGSQTPVKDISIDEIVTSQTNFESAPVTITTELTASGFSGETIMVELLDSKNEQLQLQEVRRIEDGRPFAVRFQLKPADRGVNVFRIRAFVEGQQESQTVSDEATTVNNQRTVIVDRGKGPFQILYVAGRPNWEYKFIRRSIAEDNELDLVGLLRVAKKEPKFTFRGNSGESTNPLYRGFGNSRDETAEQYDEPVMIRLDTSAPNQLRNGFPKDTAELYEYDGIILDDIEASFFSQEQKSLLQDFVSARGGGLLMLGGIDTFAAGGYDRTAIGEMLPVYLDARPGQSPPKQLRLNLTREGWIQPWVRMKATRASEENRLDRMPGFQTVNEVRSIKPGATVLANVETEDGRILPALAVQRFGKGRSSALLIGDLWRWQLASNLENDDLSKSWRQTLRWLVSDVPRRVEVDVAHDGDSSNRTSIAVQVHDADFLPLLNAEVQLEITTPEGKQIQLSAEQSDGVPGKYESPFVSRETGAYRVLATVNSPDGTLVETRESGWVSDPAVDEFQSLKPNREFLQRLADSTGGELLEMDDLDSFVDSFENRKVPVTETKTRPWWHRWPIFTLAIFLLCAEWGIRRFNGLA